jgi:hypothetical protein
MRQALRAQGVLHSWLQHSTDTEFAPCIPRGGTKLGTVSENISTGFLNRQGKPVVILRDCAERHAGARRPRACVQRARRRCRAACVGDGCELSARGGGDSCARRVWARSAYRRGVGVLAWVRRGLRPCRSGAARKGWHGCASARAPMTCGAKRSAGASRWRPGRPEPAPCRTTRGRARGASAQRWRAFRGGAEARWGARPRAPRRSTRAYRFTGGAGASQVEDHSGGGGRRLV